MLQAGRSRIRFRMVPLELFIDIILPPALWPWDRLILQQKWVDSSWNVMAHGDAREGKWRGYWRMEWVASTLHTTSEHDVSSITTADAHNSAASSRLNWRPCADLNGLVRFAERRNLVAARVPSHFKRSLPGYLLEVKAAGADHLITIRYRLSRNSGGLSLLKP